MPHPRRRRGTRRVLALSLALTICACAGNPYVLRLDTTDWILALGSDDLFESDTAESALLSLGPAAIPVLEHALDRESPAVRSGAIEVLWRLQLPESDRLLVRAATGDPDAEVRYEAVRTLDDVRDPGRVAAVESALVDPSNRVRMAAAQLCARLCVSEVGIDRLTQLALTDSGTTAAWARAGLSRILAEADGTRSTTVRAAIERRAELRSDAGLHERARAALLRTDIGEPADVATLIEGATRATDVRLRLHALYVLGNAGGAEVAAGIAALSGDRNPTVAAYSCDALRKMAARDVPGAAQELPRCAGPVPAEALPRPAP